MKKILPLVLVLYSCIITAVAVYFILVWLSEKKEIASERDDLKAQIEKKSQSNNQCDNYIEERDNCQLQLSTLQDQNETLLSEVVANLASAEQKTRDSRRKADLAVVRTALELYYDDYVGYPPAVDYANLKNFLVSRYLTILPQDSVNTQNYIYEGSTSTFTLTADLESEEQTYTVYSSN